MLRPAIPLSYSISSLPPFAAIWLYYKKYRHVGVDGILTIYHVFFTDLPAVFPDMVLGCIEDQYRPPEKTCECAGM
jgi:hypothetical protein